jgi:hypothetical protein
MSRIAMLMMCLVCNTELKGHVFGPGLWVVSRNNRAVVADALCGWEGECNESPIINYTHLTVLISGSGLPNSVCNLLRMA